MKTRLSTYNNDWYKPGGRIKILLWYFFNLVFIANPYNPISKLKVAILRLFGARIGAGVIIKQCVNVKYPWKLEIGNDVWIGENVWIDNLDDVIMEDNVCISQGAMLLCGNHNYKKSSFDLIIKPITLKEGAWVGAQSTVCPGVTVHSHAVLAVGSVATKDLDPYFIYHGVPAIKVRERHID